MINQGLEILNCMWVLMIFGEGWGSDEGGVSERKEGR
jgi:hypothetical protein